MQDVAQVVGIQAPSLYKRYADRAALLRDVRLSVSAQVQRTLARAATTGNASDDLRAIARAQHSYALRAPHLYALLFTGVPLAVADHESTAALVLDRMAVHGEPRNALAAARLLVSFVHGFSTMECAGAFHLGGSVEASFDSGLDLLLASTKR